MGGQRGQRAFCGGRRPSWHHHQVGHHWPPPTEARSPLARAPGDLANPNQRVGCLRAGAQSRGRSAALAAPLAARAASSSTAPACPHRPCSNQIYRLAIPGASGSRGQFRGAAAAREAEERGESSAGEQVVEAGCQLARDVMQHRGNGGAEGGGGKLGLLVQEGEAAREGHRGGSKKCVRLIRRGGVGWGWRVRGRFRLVGAKLESAGRRGIMIGTGMSRWAARQRLKG